MAITAPQAGCGPFPLRKGLMDQTTKDSLADKKSRFDTFAEWGVVAVVAGVVFEALFASIAPSPFPAVDHWAPVISNILVALGVIAEFHFGRLASDALKELLSISDRETAEMHERAAKLEQLTAWRHISPQQQGKIVEALRSIAPSLHLFFEYQNGDQEAFTYAGEVAQVFVTAGLINPIRHTPNLWMRGGMFGASISVSPDIDISSILTPFEAAGVKLEVKDWNALKMWPIPQGQPRPNVLIAVYPKPPPEFPSAANAVEAEKT
jgi:hypothetical protein